MTQPNVPNKNKQGASNELPGEQRDKQTKMQQDNQRHVDNRSMHREGVSDELQRQAPGRGDEGRPRDGGNRG